MSAAPPPEPAAHAARNGLCRNCGAVAPGNYCAECGQATAAHTPSMGEFVHEFVSHYIAAEGKLWRTLMLLAVHPGRLTLEYLAGRRQRYIVPLRLYLTASFLFFAVAQLTGVQWGTEGAKAPVKVDLRIGDASPGTGAGAKGQRGHVILIETPDGEGIQALRDEHLERCLEAGNTCSWTRRLVAPALVRLQADPQHVMERFEERFRHSLSYAMFLLLPLFAALLALAYRGRHAYYGEHLVFALHVHSFWFLAGLVMMLLPEEVATLAPVVYPVYGFWALHRVYGGGWPGTLLRGLLVMTIYAFAMGMGAAGLTLWLLAT